MNTAPHSDRRRTRIVAALAAAALVGATAGCQSGGPSADRDRTPPVPLLPPAGTSTCTDGLDDGDDGPGDNVFLPFDRKDIARTDVTVTDDAIVTTWAMSEPLNSETRGGLPITLNTALETERGTVDIAIGNTVYSSEPNRWGAAMTRRGPGHRIVEGNVTQVAPHVISAAFRTDDPSFTRLARNARLGTGFTWRAWLTYQAPDWLWIDTCPGAGEPAGSLDFTTTGGSGAAEEPTPETDPVAVDQELDTRLDATWEQQFRTQLTAAEPVIAQAYLTGTWWAIADFCIVASDHTETDCYQIALDYLTDRFGADLDPARSAQPAGAVGEIIAAGYADTAPSLKLPESGATSDQDRPDLG